MKFPAWLKIYGVKSYRGPCATESQEQITFFSMLRLKYPELAKITVHVRNEGKRSWGQIAQQKKEGFGSKAADIIIVGNPTLVIELKRRDHIKSKWQPGQVEFLSIAEENGAIVCVALGADAAMEAVENYAKLCNVR